MEHVNHPKHYNSHPNGIECIDIIRHYVCDIANAIKYLWRAGLKAEMGMEDAEKEIEDLKKALWYIEDYRRKIPQLLLCHFKTRARMQQIVIEVTGHAVDEIAFCGYDGYVATAIGHLLCIGIIRQGEVRVSERWEEDIQLAAKAIHTRILNIKPQLIPLKPVPPTFKEVDIKAEVEQWDVHSGFTGKVDIAQRRYDFPIPYALSYDFGPYQTKDELENQQISILERIAGDCMAMADFIKKTQ